MPKGRPRKASLVWVRCLGPGPEHRFASSDAARNRVCRACRAKMDAMATRAWESPAVVEERR